MDDPTPGLDGAGESAEELELNPVANPDEETNGSGGDPLDEITDEKARAEAKKHRAIARRVEKGEKETPATPEKKPEEPKTPSSEFLTKADFYKSNERKAIREVTTDAEVKANWNEIIAYYTSRRGKETPEDIKEDIQDAITLYKARHTSPEKDTSANVLTASPVVKTGGAPIVSKQTSSTPNPPNFKLPNQPKDWYKKKE